MPKLQLIIPNLATIPINYGLALENAVYVYARTHGCSVSIGRIGSLECDFIFRQRDANYAYAQVATTIMADITTENREYAPLKRIGDNYPKFVLTRIANVLVDKTIFAVVFMKIKRNKWRGICKMMVIILFMCLWD